MFGDVVAKYWMDKYIQGRDIAAARTLFLSFLLIFIFQIETVLAQTYGYDSAYKMLTSTAGWREDVVIISMLLHSSPQHLIENLTFLIPFGFLFAKRTSISVFFKYIFVVGIVTTAVAPFVSTLIGFRSGLGVGISGVNYALIYQESIYLFFGWIRKSRQGCTTIRYFAILIVALFVAIVHIIQLVQGPTQPGVSYIGHLAGAIIGVAYVIWNIITRD